MTFLFYQLPFDQFDVGSNPSHRDLFLTYDTVSSYFSKRTERCQRNFLGLS